MKKGNQFTNEKAAYLNSNQPSNDINVIEERTKSELTYLKQLLIQNNDPVTIDYVLLRQTIEQEKLAMIREIRKMKKNNC